MDAVAALSPGSGLIGASCAALGLSRASFDRRKRPARMARPRPKPTRALGDDERQAVLELLRSPRFIDLAPAEVYASLLDEGVYLCSIRTMYRFLTANDEVRERRRQLRHPAYQKPELLAQGPNQVWSWDISKLMGPAKWSYFYLYVIIDIFSRRVVGWHIADAETAALFKPLLKTLEINGNYPRKCAFGRLGSLLLVRLDSTLSVRRGKRRKSLVHWFCGCRSRFLRLDREGRVLFCPRLTCLFEAIGF